MNQQEAFAFVRSKAEALHADMERVAKSVKTENWSEELDADELMKLAFVIGRLHGAASMAIVTMGVLENEPVH